MATWIWSLGILVAVAIVVAFGPAVLGAVPRRKRLIPPQPCRAARPTGVVRRTWLVGSCFVAAFAFAAFVAKPTGVTALWFWPLAGPFAEPMAFREYSWWSMVGFAVPLGLAIAAHPVRPNALTGCASVVGFGFWFLLGLSYTYACV